jgi:hypothetical protein
LDHELYDRQSLIEQFQASLSLGAVCIFIDGLSELCPAHALKLNKWFPSKLEAECKFIFTLNKSSLYYSELAARKSTLAHDLRIFSSDNDYRALVSLLYGISSYSSSSNDHDGNDHPSDDGAPPPLPFNDTSHAGNALYAKFLSHFYELKTSTHIDNPLYVKLIAHEIFTFDKEIYQANPGAYLDNTSSSHLERSYYFGSEGVSAGSELGLEASQAIASSVKSSNVSSNFVNVLSSYIEEVSTIREIIQKIIKRYLKRNNWSVNSDVPISTGIARTHN